MSAPDIRAVAHSIAYEHCVWAIRRRMSARDILRSVGRDGPSQASYGLAVAILEGIWLQANMARAA